MFTTLPTDFLMSKGVAKDKQDKIKSSGIDTVRMFKTYEYGVLKYRYEFVKGISIVQSVVVEVREPYEGLITACNLYLSKVR